MPKGDNQPAKIDWHPLFTRFQDSKRSDKSLTLRKWAADNNLNYTNASKQFAEIARLIGMETGVMLAPRAIEKMGDLIQSKDDQLALKASTAIADRFGFGTNGQTVNVQNNISLGVALFSKEDGEKIKTMFGGNVIDDTN